MPAAHDHVEQIALCSQQAQTPQLPDLNLQLQHGYDHQVSLELAIFLQKFEKLAQRSNIAKDVLHSLNSYPRVRSIIDNTLPRFRLFQNHEDYDAHPSSVKLEFTLEIANHFYDGEVIGEVEVQMHDHTYLLYNDPSGVYTMNCEIEKVVKEERSTMYYISFKSNRPNVIKKYINKHFDSRFCRVCFRKLTTREVIVYSNHFEIVSNDGRSLRNAKRQRLL